METAVFGPRAFGQPHPEGSLCVSSGSPYLALSTIRTPPAASPGSCDPYARGPSIPATRQRPARGEKTYLDKAGLLSTVRRGCYRITDAGRAVLAKNPERIDSAYPAQFEGFRVFNMSKGKTEEPAASEPEPGEAGQAPTPDEALARAYREIRRKVEGDLLEAGSKASPGFFEKLVVELLVKMGYGGTLEDAGQALGQRHDGGLDGIIKEDHLGLDAIYVQAKRWQNTVGRPDVQAFAGSLEGERARKGVFITTSGFSSEAREYVKKIDKKIVLIDGRLLATLMADFGIGVNTVNTYEIVRVDGDHFTEGWPSSHVEAYLELDLLEERGDGTHRALGGSGTGRPGQNFLRIPECDADSKEAGGASQGVTLRPAYGPGRETGLPLDSRKARLCWLPWRHKERTEKLLLALLTPPQVLQATPPGTSSPSRIHFRT
jgi:restriction system protein